jgi:starch phosphorylase
MNEIEPSQTSAYFSMEIGVDETCHTDSGGLGLLAGDTIRSAADMSLPLVAVTLVHRKGYFEQAVAPSGWPA